MTIEISIFCSLDSTVERLWRELESKVPHYGFQCYDWLSCWQATVGIGSCPTQPCIAVAFEDGQPVALFPFGIHRLWGGRVLCFLGGEQVDYNAPLLTADYCHQERFEALFLMVLDRLPRHDVRLFVRMPEMLAEQGAANPMPRAMACRFSDKSYAADLPNEWSTFSARLSAQFRSNTGRKWRRLAAMGDLRFVVAANPDRAVPLLEATFAQKRRRLQATGARDTLAQDDLRRFYSSLPERLGTKGCTHLSALMLGDQVLATHLGMVYGNRLYWLLPTFAGDEWERYSTGRLLLEQLLRWAISKRLSWFDFTVGGEAYKRTWCNREMSLHTSVSIVGLRGVHTGLILSLVGWAKRNKLIRGFVMAFVRHMRGGVARGGI